MAKHRFTWRSAAAPSTGLLLCKGNKVLMTLERTGSGSWYYYGMGMNSSWANTTFDDLEKAKKAVEREAAARLGKS